MARCKNTDMSMGATKKAGGGVQTSADTARKLATEMGGMKKGGKPKGNGLAVMIAIGSPKKPVKKAMGGASTMAPSGPPAPGPVRSDHKIPLKMQLAPKQPTAPTMATRAPTPMPKPVKRAQGGAGKVRKGMMTPEGVITHAMNKIRGK